MKYWNASLLPYLYSTQFNSNASAETVDREEPPELVLEVLFQRMALNDILFLITHGIAEAFGSTDFSGTSDSRYMQEAIRQVSSNIFLHLTI